MFHLFQSVICSTIPMIFLEYDLDCRFHLCHSKVISLDNVQSIDLFGTCTMLLGATKCILDKVEI